MLIISKFHDYYDRAIGMGIDKTVVYKRLVDDTNWGKEYGFNTEPRYPFVGIKRKGEIWDFTVLMYSVGFCGFWYPLVSLNGCTTNGFEKRLCPTIMYDKDEFRSFLTKFEIADEKRYGHRLLTQGGRDKFFRCKEDQTLFQKHKCPVILQDLNRGGLNYRLNPTLSEWQFQRMKDPYSAFQDIFMYISGVLGASHREIITLRDIDKIHKHGFDKFSFRKQSSKITNNATKEGKKK